MDYLTATDIYQFLQCPHWPYYERFATREEKQFKRALTDAEQSRLENGYLHERKVVEKLFAGQSILQAPSQKDPIKDFETTRELMKQGVPLIYQGTLTDGEWTGRPDLLERHEGNSRFGEWFYVPVDVKSSHALEKYQKFQLLFYATLLERIQGRFPAEPAILNADGERIPFSDADQKIAEFQSLMQELERIRAGEKPDPVLRKACHDTGPWGAICEQYANSLHDIALLYNVDVRKLRALRSVGIRTIEDAAEMDPQELDGVAKGLRAHGLEVMKRQAQALNLHSIIVRKPVEFPSTGLEIHFDIESDPPNDTDYLYGILVRSPEGDLYRPFVAERLEGEKDMWHAFLAWIETLPPDYHVYHYAAYEHTRLGVLEKRYNTNSSSLAEFKTRLIDLKEIVTHSVVFPLYFYGLKYLLPFLGYHWTGEVKAGGQSVDVFEKYLETGERALLDSIIHYNQEDVRATAYLKDWLAAYAREITSYTKPYPWENM